MFNKRHSQRTAFTLIELLAALAVLSMLVIMLFMAFSNVNRMIILGSNKMEKNQVVRAVLQQIARDLERAAYSSVGTNMYLASATANTILGISFSNSILYCLSALSESEGCTNGSAVNVGYRVTQITENNYGTVQKHALQRGSDAGTRPPVDWTTYSPPATFWQTLSDNIVGIDFQFYTDAVYSVSAADGWPTSATTNSLPTSVGITIWAIDSASYNLALKLESTDSTTAKRILTNNTHQYTSRVFLPQSTQN
ncbi:MAG: prepilin-type N-terminal cleavage/methylation domain-containing protein [Verrucomicrobiota bacterium]